MRFHTNSLKAGDPEKGRHERYLAGQGHFSLTAEPSGVRITIQRFQIHKRRLVATESSGVHTAPIEKLSLPVGSYLARLECDGFRDTLYPFTVERDQRWRPRRPGSTEVTPVQMLRHDQLDDDERHVPAGWFWCGGDTKASGAFVRQRIWVDDFAIRSLPVTNREYLDFLNDLASSDREAEALQHAPRQRPGHAGGQGPLIFSYLDGTFGLQEDADGHMLSPDWPVVMVDWFGACAYAEWLSNRSGRAYRLPSELEWEKAARGVDGRFHPWGDFLDPSWCCIRDSHPEDPKPSSVDSFPIDSSVYGVRGMAGNSRDWCLSAYREEGPNLRDGLAEIESAGNDDPSSPRIFRGGCCYYFAQFSRCATRVWYSPYFRFGSLGFRLARTLERE